MAISPFSCFLSEVTVCSEGSMAWKHFRQQQQDGTASVILLEDRTWSVMCCG